MFIKKFDSHRSRAIKIRGYNADRREVRDTMRELIAEDEQREYMAGLMTRDESLASRKGDFRVRSIKKMT